MKTSKILLLLLAVLFVPSLSCTIKQQESRAPWVYPISFGDSRATVHEFLSHATRTTEELEEFPMSGVTVWFNSKGRLTKINFQGEAGAIYSGPDSLIAANWITSDKLFYSGLTAHSNEEDFKRVLGSPIREYTDFTGEKERFMPELGMNNPETRRVWRKEGYLIDALFLASDRTDAGKVFKKGSLLWCEVSRGI